MLTYKRKVSVTVMEAAKRLGGKSKGRAAKKKDFFFYFLKFVLILK